MIKLAETLYRISCPQSPQTVRTETFLAPHACTPCTTSHCQCHTMPIHDFDGCILLFMCRRDRRAAYALAFLRLVAPTEHDSLEVTDTYFDTNEWQYATSYYTCWPKFVMFFFFFFDALTGDTRQWFDKRPDSAKGLRYGGRGSTASKCICEW